jgi:hypothetical protein
MPFPGHHNLWVDDHDGVLSERAAPFLQGGLDVGEATTRWPAISRRALATPTA